MQPPRSRREFLAGAGILGAGLVTSSPLHDAESDDPLDHPLDAWIKEFKGDHRLAIDAISLTGGQRALGYGQTFLQVNQGVYQFPRERSSLVVILRDEAAPLAFASTVWQQYRIGELVGWRDPRSGTAAVRNTVEFTLGDVVAAGGVIGACNLASRWLASRIAQRDGVPQAQVWAALEPALLQGGRLVPSGISTIQRLQVGGFAVTAVG